MTSKQILQKYLRDNLSISRRDAESVIHAKKVKVNGQPAVPGQLIDPGKDTILYNNKVVTSSKKKLTYVVLNKPTRYITSRGDPQGRKTVYDLLPSKYIDLVPVGRLDYETEGLLILTNDGDFTYKLTHPKFEIEKEYYVELDKPLTVKDKKSIELGIKSSDLTTSPCEIQFVNSKTLDKLTITIHEGQNREIRRIFSKFGYTVTYLKRVRVANLNLSDLDLPVGSYKEIPRPNL